MYSKPVTLIGARVSPTIMETVKTALRLELMENGTTPRVPVMAYLMFVRK